MAELGGSEKVTASTIATYLESVSPDRIVTGIGGFGIVAVYEGGNPGPSVLVRCELDALPIDEHLDIPHKSKTDGVAHKCGHDGHMAILAGLAEHLHANNPVRGRVLLLYQPSEETGEGAARVLADDTFRPFAPDFAIALHNLPGYTRGQVVLRNGTFASASTGLKIALRGKTSHAAEPEAGNSPALAVAQLMQVLSAMPQFHTSLHESAKVTVIHARLGEEAFGTSPGEAQVMATLRAHRQDVIDRLMAKAVSIAERTAASFDLEVETLRVEPFPATVNDDGVVEVIEQSARALGLPVRREEHPFAWSEDFGHFTNRARGALFGLGSGEKQPALHHPDYDFPDELIPAGVDMMSGVVGRLLEHSDV